MRIAIASRTVALDLDIGVLHSRSFDCVEPGPRRPWRGPSSTICRELKSIGVGFHRSSRSFFERPHCEVQSNQKLVQPARLSRILQMAAVAGLPRGPRPHSGGLAPKGLLIRNVERQNKVRTRSHF